MDNNLINIDDLVRQRLGGGEERERSGAWLRMQELLEEDKRRKPLGMVNWKRAMTYGGLLLLLGTATVGSYEVTTAFRGNGTPGTGDQPLANASNATTNGVPGSESGNSTTQQNPTDGNTVGNATGTPANHNKPGKHNGQSGSNISSTSANATTGVVAAVNNNSHQTVTEQGINKDGQSNAERVPQAGIPVHNNSNSVANTHVAHTNSNVNNTNSSVNNTNSRVTNTKSSVTNSSTSVNHTNKTALTALTPAYTKTTHNNGVSVAQPMANQGIRNNSSAVTVDQSHATTGTSVAANGTNNASTGVRDNITMDKLALNAAATTTGASIKSADYQQPIVPVAQNANVAKPVSSGAVAHKVATVTPAKKVTNTGKARLSMAISAAKKQSTQKSAGSPKGGGYTSGGTNSGTAANSTQGVHGGMKMTTEEEDNLKIYGADGSEIEDNNSMKISTPRHRGHANNSSARKPLNAVASAAPTSANDKAATEDKDIVKKQTVRNINLRQKRTGTYPGRIQTELDTTSVDVADEVTVEKRNAAGQGKNSGPSAEVAENVYSAGAGSAQSQKAANNPSFSKNTQTNAAGKQGNGNTASASGSSAGSATALAASPLVASAAPSPVVPAAAAPATATTPVETKAAIANKKKKGSHFFENISAAFNDVKLRIKGAQFAPGLTAGINGTFFGPNSFKGFQFGGTANFELDDKWSFMAELKYFHRMNNNFAMYDTYIDYKNNDSVTNTFSFSTLHSFEMPLSFRYSVKNFDFFAGGNFVYTLSVNTGPAPLSFRGGVPYAPGQTSAPQLAESDFSARCGIGYLLGVAYKVNPNVTLDFRNVQSVWDNMKSTGATKVSAELYKSPSLQFSLLYRLGAGKK